MCFQHSGVSKRFAAPDKVHDSTARCVSTGVLIGIVLFCRVDLGVSKSQGPYYRPQLAGLQDTR